MWHPESCKQCKQAVENMLRKLFGQVNINHSLGLPCRIDDYKSSPFFDSLNVIYNQLINYRNHTNFVRVNKLRRVDFFVPSKNLIVEFDEYQHFTIPRAIALKHYSPDVKLGFSREEWLTRCERLEKKDNSPVYRDEQRAWYDTLRDFAPTVLGRGVTIRLYSKELVWCSLNPRKQHDVDVFQQYMR